MTSFNGPWMTLGGEPIAGMSAPGLRVHADSWTPQQMSAVDQAYQQFVNAVRLTCFPDGYHVRDDEFADGTRVRMVSNGGVHEIEVWPAGGSVEPPYALMATGIFTSFAYPAGLQREGEVLSGRPKISSLWKNPPIKNGPPKFAHDQRALHSAPGWISFPGNMDWSDRRTGEDAVFRGYVLSWWSLCSGHDAVRRGRYDTGHEEVRPYHMRDLSGGYGVGESYILWCNGIPVVQIPTTYRIVGACLTRIADVLDGSGDFYRILAVRNGPWSESAMVLFVAEAKLSLPVRQGPVVMAYGGLGVKDIGGIPIQQLTAAYGTAHCNSSGTRFISSFANGFAQDAATIREGVVEVDLQTFQIVGKHFPFVVRDRTAGDTTYSVNDAGDDSGGTYRREVRTVNNVSSAEVLAADYIGDDPVYVAAITETSYGVETVETVTDSVSHATFYDTLREREVVLTASYSRQQNEVRREFSSTKLVITHSHFGEIASEVFEREDTTTSYENSSATYGDYGFGNSWNGPPKIWAPTADHGSSGWVRSMSAATLHGVTLAGDLRCGLFDLVVLSTLQSGASRSKTADYQGSGSFTGSPDGYPTYPIFTETTTDNGYASESDLSYALVNDARRYYRGSLISRRVSTPVTTFKPGSSSVDDPYTTTSYQYGDDGPLWIGGYSADHANTSDQGVSSVGTPYTEKSPSRSLETLPATTFKSFATSPDGALAVVSTLSITNTVEVPYRASAEYGLDKRLWSYFDSQVSQVESKTEFVTLADGAYVSTTVDAGEAGSISGASPVLTNMLLLGVAERVKPT